VIARPPKEEESQDSVDHINQGDQNNQHANDIDQQINALHGALGDSVHGAGRFLRGTIWPAVVPPLPGS